MPHPNGPSRDAERRRIGQLVRDLRIARELSVTDLAGAAGFATPAQLSNIEAGRKGLKPWRAARIAEVLDVPVSLLFEREFADAVATATAVDAARRLRDVRDVQDVAS